MESNKRFKGMLKNKGGSAGNPKVSSCLPSYHTLFPGKKDRAGFDLSTTSWWETNSITGTDGRRQDTPSSAAARKQTSQQRGKASKIKMRVELEEQLFYAALQRRCID
ncbi:hypothetical protein CDAR_575221 [Caerostris darwini]|uniref:Uncharacterized protein n=1 Tax=Caerostris darwini TaxID=1538125 RepID=A0AAV4MY88_9ARAC|nr:hypothetical protein CDAR_575221 [Caerostris darwini]